MPTLKIQTNWQPGGRPASNKISNLLRAASQKVAEILGKPERYVMVSYEPNDHMLFGGDASPLAYLELKSIGLPEARTAEISAALCALVNELTGIPQDRIYIEFSNAERHMWGWNGGTF